MATADFDFLDTGSFTIVTALTPKAHKHLKRHTSGTWLQGGLCVEARYAADLSAQLCRDGFSVDLPGGRVVTAADLAWEM